MCLLILLHKAKDYGAEVCVRERLSTAITEPLTSAVPESEYKCSTNGHFYYYFNEKVSFSLGYVPYVQMTSYIKSLDSSFTVLPARP